MDSFFWKMLFPSSHYHGGRSICLYVTSLNFFIHNMISSSWKEHLNKNTFTHIQSININQDPMAIFYSTTSREQVFTFSHIAKVKCFGVMFGISIHIYHPWLAKILTLWIDQYFCKPISILGNCKHIYLIQSAPSFS